MTMKQNGINYIMQNLNDAIALNRITEWEEFCDIVDQIKKHPSQPTNRKAVEMIEENANGRYTLSLSVYRSLFKMP